MKKCIQYSNEYIQWRRVQDMDGYLWTAAWVWGRGSSLYPSLCISLSCLMSLFITDQVQKFLPHSPSFLWTLWIISVEFAPYSRKEVLSLKYMYVCMYLDALGSGLRHVILHCDEWTPFIASCGPRSCRMESLMLLWSANSGIEPVSSAQRGGFLNLTTKDVPFLSF